MLRALKAGASVTVIKVTDGAALGEVSEGPAMGEARKREELRALKLLGLPREQPVLLGFPDGGLEALRNTWRRPVGAPYYDPWLRTDCVAGHDAYRPGVPFFGDNVVALLAELFRRAQPTHLFTHCTRDRHPDHRAVTHFVKLALAQLLIDGHLDAAPAIFEYLTYHTRTKWPANAGRLISARKAAELRFDGTLVDFRLSPAEQRVKNAAWKCFLPKLGPGYIARWRRANEIFWRTEILPSGEDAP
jgi:LmbE family N-acetylglucosaminyl deacetylase